jgi:hypothetical protein
MLHVRRPKRVREVAGVPRYMYGNLVRAVGHVARSAMRSEAKGERFDAELTAWDVAGFVYGRHFFRSPEERGDTAAAHAEPKAAAAGHGGWQ